MARTAALSPLRKAMAVCLEFNLVNELVRTSTPHDQKLLSHIYRKYERCIAHICYYLLEQFTGMSCPYVEVRMNWKMFSMPAKVRVGFRLTTKSLPVDLRAVIWAKRAGVRRNGATGRGNRSSTSSCFATGRTLISSNGFPQICL